MKLHRSLLLLLLTAMALAGCVDRGNWKPAPQLEAQSLTSAQALKDAPRRCGGLAGRWLVAQLRRPAAGRAGRGGARRQPEPGDRPGAPARRPGAGGRRRAQGSRHAPRSMRRSRASAIRRMTSIRRRSGAPGRPTRVRRWTSAGSWISGDATVSCSRPRSPASRPPRRTGRPRAWRSRWRWCRPTSSSTSTMRCSMSPTTTSSSSSRSSI